MRSGLLILISLGAWVAACANNPPPPMPTEAACPDPDPMTLTWDSFGQKFMSDFCTDCHASALHGAQRNGAPLYHDFDTLLGTMQIHGHVDEYAGSGPAADNLLMPPARCPTSPGGPLDRDCPQPSEQQRKDLSVWLACEANRNTF